MTDVSDSQTKFTCECCNAVLGAEELWKPSTTPLNVKLLEPAIQCPQCGGALFRQATQ